MSCAGMETRPGAPRVLRPRSAGGLGMRAPLAALPRLVAAAMLLLGVVLPLCAQPVPTGPRPKVVVISLDAFAAASLHEANLPAPTFLHASQPASGPMNV